MEKGKRILIAPLDWGLGHVIRCIPIINRLIQEGHYIRVACSNKTRNFLDRELPRLNYVELPSHQYHYRSHIGVTYAIAKQLKQFSNEIKTDQKFIEAYSKSNPIDLIISDNRYGFFHPEIRSVIISHQLKPPFPLFKNILQQKVSKWINRFDECWVPDSQNHALSGELSNPSAIDIPLKFLGPLSRLNPVEEKKIERKFLFLISGPEPLRAQFESHCRVIIEKQGLNAAIVRGTAAKGSQTQSTLLSFDLLNTSELAHLIATSEIIVSRMGYSTLMDLSVLNKPAVLVPTKGQKEQEYLAKLHQENTQFKILSEAEFLEFDFNSLNKNSFTYNKSGSGMLDLELIN